MSNAKCIILTTLVTLAAPFVGWTITSSWWDLVFWHSNSEGFANLMGFFMAVICLVGYVTTLGFIWPKVVKAIWDA